MDGLGGIFPRPSSQSAPSGGPEEADNHAVSSSGAIGAAPEVRQVVLPTSGRGRKRPRPALAPSHVHVSAVLAKCPKLAARFPDSDHIFNFSLCVSGRHCAYLLLR